MTYLRSVMASRITSLTIVYSTVYSGTDQRKHNCLTSLAFLRGIHRSPVNSLHKVPVTRKMFPFDEVIMLSLNIDQGHVPERSDCTMSQNLKNARFKCNVFISFWYLSGVSALILWWKWYVNHFMQFHCFGISWDCIIYFLCLPTALMQYKDVWPVPL